MNDNFFRDLKYLTLVFSFLLVQVAYGQELNLYSSRHYDTDLRLYDNFTTQTNIRINLIEGKGDQLIQRIIAEGRNSPADILITVDAGRLWRADQAGLFRPIQSTILNERIPEHLRHPDGHWFGFSKRARVIIYNRYDNNLSKRPMSYEDLADPIFRGMVCIRSSSNIYQLSLLSSLIEIYGKDEAQEWAQGVVANFARRPRGNDTAQIRDVATGRCRIAVVNSYYIARLLGSQNLSDVSLAQALTVVFPNQGQQKLTHDCEPDPLTRGTHVNISGAGILKHAPNPTEALMFLEYLVTVEAQRFFAEGNHEYPVVKTVPISNALSSLGTFIEDQLNMSVLGKNQPTAVRVYDRAGWR